MDSDIVSRLKTPDGPLVLLPYPVVAIDMGQHLVRMKTPAEIETLWLDYVLELASEARADPARDATTVVIEIHPFVIGTPDGAAAMRRVLSRPRRSRLRDERQRAARALRPRQTAHRRAHEAGDTVGVPRLEAHDGVRHGEARHPPAG